MLYAEKMKLVQKYSLKTRPTSQGFLHPCPPNHYERTYLTKVMKRMVKDGMSISDIADLFSITEYGMKYQIDRYVLKTWTPKTKKPVAKKAGCKLTHADITTMFEALNGYIHLEKNCSEHGPEAKFFTLHRKLEDYLVGGA